MSSQGLRVSAPGKVLLTGGYLILEERYAGVVLATSARFYTTIARRRMSDQAVDEEEKVVLRIHVESPQFHQTVIAHAVCVANTRIEIRVSDQHDRNEYIEDTLLCALNGVVGLDAVAFFNVCETMCANAKELYIRLEADNDFYSQVTRLQQAGKSLSRQSLQELPVFMPPIMEADAATGKTSIAKTGLGSSAALVTSLVGAIVEFFGHDTKRDEMDTRDVIHNLAQLCHCFVQRKIGSGFDVSAACYGSQRYSRFSRAILDEFTSAQSLDPPSIAHCVRNHTQWKRPERVEPFSLPSNFHLLMGDVSTGSGTVSMVKQVLRWQKTNPTDATRVVHALADANTAVEQSFRTLSTLSAVDSTAFTSKCTEMAQRSSHEWTSVDSTVGRALIELRNHYQDVRRYFREMGKLAGVPIEPNEQTALIDAALEVPGVLIAGVPGAGGYDALFILTLDITTIDRVEALWLTWSETHPDTVICPLLCDVASSTANALLVESL